MVFTDFLLSFVGCRSSNSPTKQAKMSKQVMMRFRFDRKKSATKTKEAPIVLEVYHQRARRYLDTGFRVCSHQWNRRLQRVTNHPSALNINEALDAILIRNQSLAVELSSPPNEFSLEAFMDIVSRRDRSHPKTFERFMASRIEERKLSASSRKQHRVVYRAVVESGLFQAFSDLTPYNIARFDAFLRNVKGLTHQVTVANYHKRLKTYIHEAMAFELIDRDPYLGFKVSRGTPKSIRYLNRQEVDNLLSTVLLDRVLTRIRDLFIFQMFTGLSYSDMMALDYTRAERREDGMLYIRDQRLKTKEEYYICLLPKAEEVLERYGFHLPQYSNQKYNAYLKVLAMACHIDKPLSSHMARHTFATTITLSNGVPMQIVAKMMGHSNIKTTQMYAKVLAEDVASEFGRLSKVFG